MNFNDLKIGLRVSYNSMSSMYGHKKGTITEIQYGEVWEVDTVIEVRWDKYNTGHYTCEELKIAYEPSDLLKDLL